MPRSQTANTGVYSFGAASAGTSDALATVFVAKVRHGGVLNFRIENLGRDATTGDLTVSIEVAPMDADGVGPGTYVATTAANNLTAVTDVVIPARVFRDFEILLREVADAFVRVHAVGSVQGDIQINGDQNLQIEQIRRDPVA